MSIANPRVVTDCLSFDERMEFIRRQKEKDRQRAERSRDNSAPVDSCRIRTSAYSGGCVGNYSSAIDEEVGSGVTSIFHEEW